MPGDLDELRAGLDLDAHSGLGGAPAQAREFIVWSSCCYGIGQRHGPERGDVHAIGHGDTNADRGPAAAHYGQGIAHDLQQLGGGGWVKSAVHRAAEGDIGHRRQLLAQVHDARAQPLSLQPDRQVKDGVPDDADDMIEVVDGLLDPAAHQWVGRYLRSALQIQTDCEHSPDDLGLKFRGNAVAFPQDVSVTARVRRLTRITWRTHREAPFYRKGA